MSTSTLSRANGKGKTKAGPPPSSLINFSLSGEGEAAARHKRAKFNAERRLQVKSVRKRGACMRCRLLKIPCSDDQCCMACLRVAKASHAHEKRMLSFVGCVRTSLSDVNVFAHVAPQKTPGTALQKASGQYINTCLSRGNLILEPRRGYYAMSLALSYQLNIPVLIISDFQKMLYKNAVTFENLTKFVPFDLNRVISPSVSCFTELFLATMDFRMEPRPLFAAGVFEGACIKLRSLGEKCLRILDEMLKPIYLSSLGKADLQVLFVLIFGTIFSVGHAKPALELPTFPQESLANPEIPRTIFEVMQEHICNMLAYYMYFIASKVGMPNIEGWKKNLDDLAEIRKLGEEVILTWAVIIRPRGFPNIG